MSEEQNTRKKFNTYIKKAGVIHRPKSAANHTVHQKKIMIILHLWCEPRTESMREKGFDRSNFVFFLYDNMKCRNQNQAVRQCVYTGTMYNTVNFFQIQTHNTIVFFFFFSHFEKMFRYFLYVVQFTACVYVGIYIEFRNLYNKTNI